MQDFDVIVVGGGHNGLVCAFYMAQAGLRVAVVERRRALGGPAGRREFMPGYFSTISNSPGSLEPRIVRDLGLERLGVEFVKPDPTLVHPLDDGSLFLGWRDTARTDRQLDGFAPGEAGRYHALFDYLQWFADRLGVSVFREPPSLKELVRNLDGLDEQEAFSRILFGSARALFEEFALEARTQALIGPLATVSGIVGPSTPGTPFNLMMRPLSLASLAGDDGYDPRRMPLRGSTGLPIGGMGAIVDAMERAVLAEGGRISTGTGVARILCDGGRAAGVALADGRVLRAPVVVSAVSPHLTARLVETDDPAWTGLRGKLERRPLRGKAFKIVLALGDIPRYAAARDEAEARLLAAAQFRIAPTLDYIEDSHADMLRGRVPERPIVWGLCHTLTSPALAPPGKHVLSLNIGNAPYRLRDGDWARERDGLCARVIETVSRWIPNLPDVVEDMRCIDPLQFEDEYGLVEANIAHGDMLPFQQFWMRPMAGLHRYRTPTSGLYLSGAGTWPGSFVSGIPGHNTAQAVLADLRAGLDVAAGARRRILETEGD